MEAADFFRLIAQMQDEEMRILKTKGTEYTRADDDQLANFKRIAESLGLDPLVVWSVYFHKHIDSIFHFVKAGKVLSEDIKGRFQDARNYLALGYALIKEKQDNQ